MCDGNEKQTMGFIYEAMDRAKNIEISLIEDGVLNFIMICILLVRWWIHYESCSSQLQHIAVRVLNQATSSSNCKCNWSTFSLILTKKRNRRKYKKLQKLVYVHYNMKLKLKHMRKCVQELEMGFNQITQQYF
ncbi:Copia protein [Gossypium australe]|uniref:Copia protein n=1 Tax=Gossypium australe TaxID=47621 RepID=A0A5B6WEW2_9ROSI|nr:Copia protein [Gossypium australe]